VPAAGRPRVFGALSAAWVVPALVGPALAGLVTSVFGWR
jgi:MFS family permease